MSTPAPYETEHTSPATRSDRAIWIALAVAVSLFAISLPVVYLAVPGGTLLEAARIAGVSSLVVVAAAILLIGLIAEWRTAMAGMAGHGRGGELAMPMAEAA